MRNTLFVGSFAIVLLTATGARAASDDQFLANAIKGDNSEIMLGHLAGEKGGSAEVRNAGMTIEGDHAKSLIEAKKLADARGMKAPTAPTAEATGEEKKLSAMTGTKFDKEFASYMVDDHKKDIAKFREEVASGSGVVAKFAEMSIPVLEKHLALAEQIEKGGK